MVRKLVSAWAVAALTVALSVGGYSADDEKTPPTKEIMKKMQGKTDAPGLIKRSKDAGKDEKWEDAQKLAKEMAELGKAVGKNKPPKGDAESWEKLTKKYAEHTAAIAEAAEKKDTKAHADAVKAFTDSCMACHMEHRPAKKK